MSIILHFYLMACIIALALCWLGSVVCILVAIFETICNAGTLGPRFVTHFTAQSRSGQLCARAQLAMQLAQRFGRWSSYPWRAALVGMVVGMVRALFLE